LRKKAKRSESVGARLHASSVVERCPAKDHAAHCKKKKGRAANGKKMKKAPAIMPW